MRTTTAIAPILKWRLSVPQTGRLFTRKVYRDIVIDRLIIVASIKVFKFVY